MSKKENSTKYIFVVGGVMSGIGKGVANSSIGKILQSKGYSVTAVKIDPYVNVDAGTMNPVEHGEVFVTADGVECDQDIGNYERFLNTTLSTHNYMTTGRVYKSVIEKERNLEYDGKCVEVVPDIPNEVISRIKKAGEINDVDFVLTEIGGTIGEYQNMLFLEAARMMKLEHPKDVLFIMVSYLPVPEMIGEMKTKPTQHAARTLNSAGIRPDIILGRAEVPLDEPRKRKISVFCNVDKKDVISAPDVNTIYEVPLNFERDNLGNQILEKFDLEPKESDLKDWREMVDVIKNADEKVKIGMVGKYFETGEFTLSDSYISVIEAINHSSWANNRKADIFWLSAEEFEEDPSKLEKLKRFDGVVIPGGFGSRGTEGKIKTAQYCRENNIPYLGLCLGMQLATIEFARHVAGIEDANSTEFDKKCTPIIDIMPEQKELLENKDYGGTMRLGTYKCQLKKGTISSQVYNKDIIEERHRHRYEFNDKFREKLEESGLTIAGTNPKTDLVEIIELEDHPFFVGTQFHPEFQSKPLHPHPLFKEFVKVAIQHSQT